MEGDSVVLLASGANVVVDSVFAEGRLVVDDVLAESVVVVPSGDIVVVICLGRWVVDLVGASRLSTVMLSIRT